MSTDPLRGDSAAERNLKDLREAITSLLGLVSNLPALTPRPLTVEERETLERLDKRVIALLDALGMRRPEVRPVLIDPLRRYGMTQIAAYLPSRHPPGVGPDELIVAPDQFGGWENELRVKLEEIEIRLRSFPDRHNPPNAATPTAPAAGPGGAEEAGADRDQGRKQPEADPAAGLAPSRKKAVRQYLDAVSKCPELKGAKDRDIYDWIEMHSDDDPLPSFASWSRYLREAREATGTSKNTPRAGRTGRSIVRHEEI